MKLTQTRVYLQTPLVIQNGDEVQGCEFIYLLDPTIPVQVFAGAIFRFSVVRSARLMDRVRFWWLRTFTRRLLELQPGFWVMA